MTPPIPNEKPLDVSDRLSPCQDLASNGECVAREGCCIPWLVWERQDNNEHEPEWFCSQGEDYQSKFK